LVLSWHKSILSATRKKKQEVKKKKWLELNTVLTDKNIIMVLPIDGTQKDYARKVAAIYNRFGKIDRLINNQKSHRTFGTVFFSR